MLAPHHRKDAQFRDIRIAPEDALDAGILLVGEAVLYDDFSGDGGLDHCARARTILEMQRTCEAVVRRMRMKFTADGLCPVASSVS